MDPNQHPSHRVEPQDEARPEGTERAVTDETPSLPTEDDTVHEAVPNESDEPSDDMADVVDSVAHDPTTSVDETSADGTQGGVTASSESNDGKLTEEAVDKLIQKIADEVMRRQATSKLPSAEQLQGIVLRVLDRRDSSARDNTEDPQGERGSREPHAEEEHEAVETPTKDELSTPSSQESVAQPPLIVLVQLANAREILEKERHAMVQETAITLEQIVDSRIELAFWRRQNQERAADYRLRGGWIG